MMRTMADNEPEDSSKPGYAGYSPFVLALYDFWVHGLNNRFFWKCPTRRLIEHYRTCLTANHLEIGPGTGYLLERSGFPETRPRLVLCDMNAHCLGKAGRRLGRFRPALVRRDVLQPLRGLGERFRSVGMNYVLHCLPGDLVSKGRVFGHVAECLEPGGTFFGSTILGGGVPLSRPARLQLWLLNRRGHLSNRHDTLGDLEAGLEAVFTDCRIETQGCVALFSAKARPSASAADAKAGPPALV